MSESDDKYQIFGSLATAFHRISLENISLSKYLRYTTTTRVTLKLQNLCLFSKRKLLTLFYATGKNVPLKGHLNSTLSAPFCAVQRRPNVVFIILHPFSGVEPTRIICFPFFPQKNVSRMQEDVANSLSILRLFNGLFVCFLFDVVPIRI